MSELSEFVQEELWKGVQLALIFTGVAMAFLVYARFWG